MFVTPLLEKKRGVAVAKICLKRLFFNQTRILSNWNKMSTEHLFTTVAKFEKLLKKMGELRCLVLWKKKAKEMEPKTFQRFVSSKDDTHVLFFAVGLILREVDENKKNLCLSKVKDVISRSGQKMTLFFVVASIVFTFLLKGEKNKPAWINISVTYPLVKTYIDEFLVTQGDWEFHICVLGFLKSIWNNPADKIMVLIVHLFPVSSLWI